MKRLKLWLWRYRRRFIGLTLLAVLAVVSPFLIRLFVVWNYGRFILPIDEVDPTSVAIVFGAQVYGDGRLSAVLRDRMDVAIELYHAGQVEKLLVTGDNQFVEYDEPSDMMAYAIARGVPVADVQPDYGGRRTYDSCYRAKHIFGVETAVLVTQSFHLPRALMSCRQLGIESVGVSASLRPYALDRYFALREIAATNLAIWDLLQANPAPVMGETIPFLVD